MTISGPEAVCETGTFTYTLQNAAPGVIATWSTSPSGIVTPASGTGTSFTVNAITNTTKSNVQVTATTTGNCPFQSSQTIWVGAPLSRPGALSQNVHPLCVGQLKVLSINAVPGTSSYNWYTNDPYIVGAEGTSVWGSVEGVGAGNGFFTIEAVNACAATMRQYGVSVDASCDECGYYPYPPCGPLLVSVSPNPTSEFVDIIVDENYQGETLPNEYRYSAELFNQFGEKVRSLISVNVYERIDMKGLVKGTYFLKIYVHSETVVRRIFLN